MGVLEPLEQNQFITPSTILKLMNCVVIPVWTYLSHIWANPTAFRTSSLWYKILSKSSNTKYKHELTKMEYICSQFPIDLEIQLSQAKFAHKNGFDSDQCSIALSDSDSKVSMSLPSSLRGFARFSGIAPGKKYSKRICEHYRIELWNRRLRNIIARIPSNRIDRTFDTKIFQQTCFQIDYWDAHKPMQSTRLSIPIIKNIVTTLYLQPRGDVFAFYLLLQFLQ